MISRPLILELEPRPLEEETPREPRPLGEEETLREPRPLGEGETPREPRPLGEGETPREPRLRAEETLREPRLRAEETASEPRLRGEKMVEERRLRSEETTAEIWGQGGEEYHDELAAKQEETGWWAWAERRILRNVCRKSRTTGCGV